MNDNLEQKNSLKMEAADWAVRMQNPETLDERLPEFELWCAENPEGREGYVQAVADLHGANTLGTSGRHGAKSTAWMVARSSSYWIKFGAMAAAGLALFYVAMANSGSDLVGAKPSTEETPAFKPLATKRGEIRIFELADGSLATLDTNSKLEVSITQQHRRLRLAQGRARFKVAPDPRPFTVEAGAREVVASEGTFDLAYDDRADVSVQLFSGKAYIRPTSQFASLNLANRPLDTNLFLSYRARDISSPLKATPAGWKGTSEWPSGWVEHKSIRLDQMIALANAYASKPIFVEDGIASLKVSGRFKISETDGFIARICELFDLAATVEANGIYLRKE